MLNKWKYQEHTILLVLTDLRVDIKQAFCRKFASTSCIIHVFARFFAYFDLHFINDRRYNKGVIEESDHNILIYR